MMQGGFALSNSCECSAARACGARAASQLQTSRSGPDGCAGSEPGPAAAQGREQQGATEGILCMKQSWPAAIRTIKGDHERFEQTYFSTFKVHLPPASPSAAAS